VNHLAEEMHRNTFSCKVIVWKTFKSLLI